MKSAIGIRANPNTVHFCIVNEIQEGIEIKILDKIVVPKALDVPEQLKFLRSTFKDIIKENEVRTGCIRITESNAKKVNINRIYMEGVIQELFANSSIIKYFIGQIASISARLGIERTDFKPYIDGEDTFMDIGIWGAINNLERESILAAVSALNI